jgi:hypothetical protein
MGVLWIMLKICKVEGCGKKLYGLGYCRSHYDAYKRYGKPELMRQVNRKPPELCTYPGCNKKHLAKGLCATHYYQAKRSGKIGFSPCTVNECKNPLYAKGFCSKHYALAHRNGKPEKKSHPCKYPNCTEYTIKNDYCGRHLSMVSVRMQAGLPITATQSDLFSGERNPRWNNGASEYPNHAEFKRQRIIKLHSVDYTCEECGAYANECHHKDKTKTNHAQNNLIVLCRKCHMSLYHAGCHRKPRKISIPNPSPSGQSLS